MGDIQILFYIFKILIMWSILLYKSFTIKFLVFFFSSYFGNFWSFGPKFIFFHLSQLRDTHGRASLGGGVYVAVLGADSRLGSHVHR